MARKRKPTQKKNREEEAFLKEPGFKKVDIGRKLIPLSVLSGREAEKTAERTIDNVLQAVTHVLSEGDLSIVDFGRFEASKSKKTGFVRITFTPSGKLKRAVEARLNAIPSPDPEIESDSASTSQSESQPATDSQSAPSVDTPPDPGPQPAAPPTPEQELVPEVTAEPGPATTPAEEATPSPEASAEPAAETTVLPAGPPVLNLDSVSVENRTLVADGQEYGLAESLSILDASGKEMNFPDQLAVLQHLTLASKITILSKTAFRIQAAGLVEVINSLQILQYRE